MIKFRSISRKFGAGIMALTIVSAVGCSNQNDNKKYYSSHTIDYNNQNVIIKEASEQSMVSETSQSEVTQSSIYESSLESSEKVSKEEVITFLENLDEKITDKSETIAYEVIDGCKTAYNFVFKGGTIKGYTLDELDDSMQQKAITIIAKIDQKIDSYLPNYKENIKISFGNTKDKIVNVAEKYGEKFKNNIIDIIGEEKFESYMGIKDELVSRGKEQLRNDIDDLKDAWSFLKNEAKSLIKKKN